MALHGDIQVNGATVGVWSAQRVDASLDEDGCYRYRCEVATRELGRRKFMLRHRYADGAVALAALVLAHPEVGGSGASALGDHEQDVQQRDQQDEEHDELHLHVLPAAAPANPGGDGS